MHDLVVFAFDTSAVRTIADKQGTPWFVLRDLLGAMESTTTVTAAVAAIEEGLGKGFVNDIPLSTSGGIQTLTIVAEAAATYLLSRSNTETGRRLNRFVHVEVLPSLRKTGAYALPAVSAAETASLEREVKRLKADVAALKRAPRQPKKDLAERVENWLVRYRPPFVSPDWIAREMLYKASITEVERQAIKAGMRRAGYSR